MSHNDILIEKCIDIAEVFNKAPYRGVKRRVSVYVDDKIRIVYTNNHGDKDDRQYRELKVYLPGQKEPVLHAQGDHGDLEMKFSSNGDAPKWREHIERIIKEHGRYDNHSKYENWVRRSDNCKPEWIWFV